MTSPRATSVPAMLGDRRQREAHTLAALVRIYCVEMHGLPGGELCPDCTGLLGYAMQRLTRCPFQEEKPTCANCPIHCYQQAYREEMRRVMRMAGPRMLLRHPLLALRHLLDGWRPRPRRRAARR
jgi:hypothetical protein